MACESKNRRRKRIRQEMSAMKARYHAALTLLNDAAYGFRTMAEQNVKLLQQHEALIADLAYRPKFITSPTV